MSALFALLLAVLVTPQGRLVSARAICTGPLAGFEIAWPDGSALHATLALAAGEERTLDLRLPLPAAGALGAPRVSADGTGTARLEPWPDARGAAFASAWERLPPGLRLRPPPPPPDRDAGRGRLPPGALLAAAAGLALVLGLRARPRAALGAGALGALLALALAAPLAPDARASEVLEGDGSAWLLARAARSRLSLDPAGGARLDVDPPEAPLAVRGADGAWEVAAPGALLVERRPVGDVPADALRAERNGLEDLPRCWLRGADGLWSHRGAWARGEPLPGAVEGPAPPAGLIAGLPQGRAVLLAERARPERPDGALAWLRVVGFPAPQGLRD